LLCGVDDTLLTICPPRLLSMPIGQKVLLLEI